MKAYMQLFDDSGNHASMQADEFVVVKSGIHARQIFDNWMEEVGRYSDVQNARAVLWFGEPCGDFPCDTYPDREVTVGPRGGINYKYV